MTHSTTLSSAADSAIKKARSNNNIITGRSEPNEVARLVASLPEQLIHAWQPFVTEGAMTVSAIFCHAKPRVSWESPLNGRLAHQPELADLLFIFDTQHNGAREERALLIQAKISDAGKLNLSTEGELVQRYMYSNWPKISLPKTPNHLLPSSSPLILSPAGINPCDIQGRYACVEQCLTADPAWLIESGPSTMSKLSDKATTFKSSGDISLSLSTSLGEGLVQIYSGLLGRRSDQKDDWSKLIKYLQSYAAHYAQQKSLPHVTSCAGAIPPPITSAKTYFANITPKFLRHSKIKHLLLGLNDWIDPHLIIPTPHGGSTLNWHISPPPGSTGLNFDDTPPGFGVIRIAIDEPLHTDGLID